MYLDDTAVSGIYCAANGRADWTQVLGGIAQSLGVWTVQLLAVDKRQGHLIFSAHGGNASPQTALDYFRTYNALDPRVPAVMSTLPGHWMHCHEHFDEHYVAQSRFYQDFLIPHGGRYVTATILLDTEGVGFILAIMRGQGSQPIQADEMPVLDRLRHHLVEAMRNVLHLRGTYAELGMARELLSQFDHPMLLVDETRGIWHRNEAATRLLAREEILFERQGFLTCRDRVSDHALTEAIHGMQLSSMDRTTSVQRRAVALLRRDGSRVLALLSPVRPDQTMGVFGHTPRALVVIHDPASAGAELDPFIIGECFDFTPAEARVAVKLADGDSAKKIAQVHGISLATVRTHIARVLEKAGVDRQQDLVRVLLTIPLRA